ncbi:MAG: GAF domain-containing protein [Thiotrichaceae bacterium]
MQTLNAEVCTIYLRKDDDPNRIICSGFWFCRRHSTAEYDIGEGFTGSVAKLDREFNIRNLQEFEALKPQGLKWQQKFDELQWKKTCGKNEFRNLLALPLKIKGEILGVIKAENKKSEFGSSFTDEDLQIFRTIANVIALTIENSRLYQQTQQQLKSISSSSSPHQQPSCKL